MMQRYAFILAPASKMPKNQCFSGVFFTPFLQKNQLTLYQSSFLSFLFISFIPLHFFHFSSFLSFLTPPSTVPGRSVQENFPHGARKFLAPRAGALSYIHHFMLFYIMPSAGAPPSAFRQSLPTKSTFKL